MIRSMTGYGKSEGVIDGHYFKFEIKSVNHRYLDISFRMPRQLQYMEDRFKNMISEKIGRGKIEVYVSYQCYAEGKYEVHVDKSLAKIYKDAYEMLGEYLGIENDLAVSNIIKAENVITLRALEEDENRLTEIACSVLKEALDKIIGMKIEEGSKLAQDILLKNQNIANLLREVEAIAPQVPVDYKERLMKRMQEFIQNDFLDENRIITEVALFADRCSIDEEIVRLKSHVDQLESLIHHDSSSGKKMDFLIQEMNREINTIGSKANNLTITKHVVEMKSELEKIREQVQNIE